MDAALCGLVLLQLAVLTARVEYVARLVAEPLWELRWSSWCVPSRF